MKGSKFESIEEARNLFKNWRKGEKKLIDSIEKKWCMGSLPEICHKKNDY